MGSGTPPQHYGHRAPHGRHTTDTRQVTFKHYTAKTNRRVLPVKATLKECPDRTDPQCFRLVGPGSIVGRNNQTGSENCINVAAIQFYNLACVRHQRFRSVVVITSA